MIKVRLQASTTPIQFQNTEFRFYKTAKNIFSNEGIKGFYKGLGTNLIGSLVAMEQFPT